MKKRRLRIESKDNMKKAQRYFLTIQRKNWEVNRKRKGKETLMKRVDE